MELTKRDVIAPTITQSDYPYRCCARIKNKLKIILTDVRTDYKHKEWSILQMQNNMTDN